MTNRAPSFFILVHMYCRVVESETETISDYLSTPTPCGRHRLAVQPQSHHFASHSLSPAPRSKNAFLVSLSCCVHPSQVFSFYMFFFYNRTVHLLYYSTRKSWSLNFLLQSRPVQSRANKRFYAQPCRTKRVVTCSPLFSPSPTALESDPLTYQARLGRKDARD